MKRVIKIAPPPKDTCGCAAFCIEDTARTGRYCKLLKRTHDRTLTPPKRGRKDKT